MAAAPAAGMDCSQLARAERIVAAIRNTWAAADGLRDALGGMASPRGEILVGSQTLRFQGGTTPLPEGAVRLVIEIIGQFRNCTAADGRDAAIAWQRHGTAVACAAAAIAEACGKPKQAPAAFAVGSLHDIGKAAALMVFPKAYGRLAEGPDAWVAGVNAERDIFGIDHATLGRAVLETWQAPPAWAEAVWLHHQPPATIARVAGAPELAMIVALANRLVHAADPVPQHLEHSDDLHDMAQRLHLGEEALASIPARQAELHQALEAALANEPAASVRRTTPRRVADRDMSSPPPDPWLAALSGFISRLSGMDSAMKICEALAAACGEAWQRPTIAYAIGSSDSTVVAACWSGGAVHSGLIPSARRGEPLVDRVFARFAGQLGNAPNEHVGFELTGRGVGGLYGSPDLGGRSSDAHCGWQILHDTVAWAMETAHARDQAVRVADALAAASRTSHEGHTSDRYDTSVASIAAMAAGAAHELNNPLAVIAGRAQMLRGSITDEETARQVALIDEQARRASQIVAELVQFAKPESPLPVSIRLGDWATRLRQYWQSRSSLGAGEILVQLADADLHFQADPAQLDEAAHAVIGNALEAMSPGNARLIINSPSRTSDENVVVSFGDNGRGMTPEVLRHACDPFFSSRPAGRGRGMGLSRAARLLQVNGGRLTIESAPDVGTRVSFVLPLCR